MPTVQIDGTTLAYDIVGDRGPAWILTPGGRFSKDHPGVRETAAALAEHGNRVVVWDRPNCGASAVCFTGESESTMHADHLAALLRHLELAPAIVAGGSAGSRVSLIAAARHPDVARALALWWISGGVYGLLGLGCYYCGSTIAAAWTGGMEAVAEMELWREPLERNPANRQALLAQDPAEFVATMERWMLAYVPDDAELVPGLAVADAARIDLPAIVFRNGTFDPNHTRVVSEQVAAALPRSTFVDPPWLDDGSMEREAMRIGFGEMFTWWPRLVPGLQQWSVALGEPGALRPM